MYRVSFIKVYHAPRAFTLIASVMFLGKVPLFKYFDIGDIQDCSAQWLVEKTIMLEIDGRSMTFNSTLHEYIMLETKLVRWFAI